RAEPGIYLAPGAIALTFVEVLPTGATQPLAVVGADGVHGEGEQHLLPHQRVQVDGPSIEELLVGALEVEAPGPRGLLVVRAVPVLPPHERGLGHQVARAAHRDS